MLAPMIRGGRLRYREEILDGIEARLAPSPISIREKTSAKRLIRLVQD